LLVAAVICFACGAPVSSQDARTVDAAPEASAETADNGWPRQFETATHIVRIHQPQVDDWENFDRIQFRAAVVIESKEVPGPLHGVIVVSAATDVAMEERLVVLSDRKLESLAFPGVEGEHLEYLKKIIIEAAPPAQPQTVSLDRLIAGLDRSKIKVREVEVNLEPPDIYASSEPAVLVMFLGKPRFKPVPDGELMYAINTNWDVFMDPAANAYYLLNGQSWWRTDDLASGSWVPATSLPEGLSKLPNDENWSDVRSALPGVPPNEIVKTIVSFKPAELVVTDGGPEFEPIPGTKLMMVSNTESDLFYSNGDRKFYLLAAGRWFSAAALEGPWSAASASLPSDFTKIPPDSDAAEVLASVPGTAAANEAVIMASIPQKATIQRTEVTVNVTYEGEPKFVPIESTTVQTAQNTPFDVFLVDGKYYCCNNAVWFEAPTPNGVWVVCDTVPAAIYTIPATSPQHNVTYVTVYESTPETVVTGYTAGYTGAQVAATGAVMFGLGLLVAEALDDDDCCWGYHYHSSCFSYGCGAVWHGYSSGYVCVGHRYGPYGGAGGFAAYNPATGVYSRGAYAYGPQGAVGVRSAYNPHTGNYAARAGGTTPYGSWSRGVVTNGDDWVRGGTRSGPRGSAAAIEGSGGAAVGRVENRWGNGVTVGRSQDGDLYAGKDGNVYKRSDSGWESLNNSNRSSGQGSASSPSGSGAARGERQPTTQGARQAQATPEQQDYLKKQAESRDRGERQARGATDRQRTGGRTGGRSGGGTRGGGRGGRR